LVGLFLQMLLLFLVLVVRELWGHKLLGQVFVLFGNDALLPLRALGHNRLCLFLAQGSTHALLSLPQSIQTDFPDSNLLIGPLLVLLLLGLNVCTSGAAPVSFLHRRI